MLFIHADGLELMFVGIGFITVPLTIYIYTRINARRDFEATQHGDEFGSPKYSPDELRELGDRAPEFRYTL